jgi:hypothetical protein
MKHLRPIWTSLILLLLLVAGSCAPPWFGEECNHHVVAVQFFDSTNYANEIPIADLGYTGFLHLERNEVVDPATWENVDELTFRQYNPARYLLLPLDVEAGQSTFVLQHPDGNDTLAVRYESEVGRDRRNNCGYAFNLFPEGITWTGVEGRSTFDVDHPGHPRILDEIYLVR